MASIDPRYKFAAVVTSRSGEYRFDTRELDSYLCPRGRRTSLVARFMPPTGAWTYQVSLCLHVHEGALRASGILLRQRCSSKVSVEQRASILRNRGGHSGISQQLGQLAKCLSEDR